MAQYSNAISLLNLVGLGVPFWFAFFLYLHRSIGDVDRGIEILYYIAHYSVWWIFAFAFLSIDTFLEMRGFPELLLNVIHILFSGIVILGAFQTILLGVTAGNEKGPWKNRFAVIFGVGTLYMAFLIFALLWLNVYDSTPAAPSSLLKT